jgi:hypothetical protein
MTPHPSRQTAGAESWLCEPQAMAVGWLCTQKMCRWTRWNFDGRLGAALSSKVLRMLCCHRVDDRDGARERQERVRTPCKPFAGLQHCSRSVPAQLESGSSHAVIARRGALLARSGRGDGVIGSSSGDERVLAMARARQIHRLASGLCASPIEIPSRMIECFRRKLRKG